MNPLEAALRRIVDDLETLGTRWAIVGGLATARLAPAAPPDVLVDLLFASSGIESEVVAGAERLDLLPGLAANVATIGHLLALKVLARDDRVRPQDLDDIRALLREATRRISRPRERLSA